MHHINISHNYLFQAQGIWSAFFLLLSGINILYCVKNSCPSGLCHSQPCLDSCTVSASINCRQNPCLSFVLITSLAFPASTSTSCNWCKICLLGQSPTLYILHAINPGLRQLHWLPVRLSITFKALFSHLKQYMLRHLIIII